MTKLFAENQTSPPTPPAPDAGAARQAMLWCIRGLLLAAVLVTFYLVVVTAAEGASPAGCGPEGGCSAVLQSRWGKWFDTPVAKPALLLYGAILAASMFVGSAQPIGRRRAAWMILVSGATLAAATGAWFIMLQAAVIKSFCPWCTALHCSGIAIAILTWLAVPFQRPTGEQMTSRQTVDLGRLPPQLTTVVAAISVIAGMGILIAGQRSAGDSSSAQIVTFGNGTLPIDLARQPYLGPVSAKHRMMLMNDYTCIHCRALHHNLDAARERYGDQFTLVMVPVPLNSKCNESVVRTAPDQAYACELANLALAVWRADPKKFPIFDKWLYEPEKPPEPDSARRFAVDLVGETALAKALADPWVSQTIQQDIKLYRMMGLGKLPKMVLQSTSADQAVRNQTPGELYDILERELELKPLPNAVNR